MHDRISVNNLCFPTSTLATDVANWRKLGARQVGVVAGKLQAEGWEASIDLLKGSGFPVATMVHLFLMEGTLDQGDRVAEAQRQLSKTIRVGRDIGARTIYMLTGGRGKLSWDEAARAFSAAVAPCAAEAREAGIELLIEPANTLFADLHIVHNLGDTLALAEQAGIGVCIDIFPIWTEPRLRATIGRAMSRCHLVQLSDYVPGDRSFPCRAVPGDGAIPLEQIVGWILEAGYEGAFDLELLGPRIDKEGHYQAVERACDRLGEMLIRLGA
jgi:sugar phosphate isomerase/epimerase